MKLASFIFYCNIAGIIALFSIALAGMQKPERITPKTISKEEDSRFSISEPKLNLKMGRDPVTLAGTKAKLNLEQSPSVMFNENVSLEYGKHLITPEILEYQFEGQLIKTKKLRLEGPPVVNVEDAILSPAQQMTELHHFTIEGDFPLKSGQKISHFNVKLLKGQVRSLDHFDRKGSRAASNQSRKASQPSKDKSTGKSETDSTPANPKKEEADPTETKKKKSTQFKLKAAYAVSPITTFSIRLKIRDLFFQTQQWSIQSKAGKFQSGLPILTFSNDVVIHKDGKDIHCDYARLNLETGVLKYSSENEMSLSE